LLSPTLLTQYLPSFYRRLITVELILKKCEKTTNKFCRARRVLESRMDVDDDRCTELEQKLREAQALLHETENKADEVCICLIFILLITCYGL
jgi:predicted RNase H-like nuclease (RuvC/YqgF family)